MHCAARRWLLAAFCLLSAGFSVSHAVLGQDAEEPIVLTGHRGAINMALFTPDGERVVTASVDHTARLWDAQSGEVIRVFEAHQGPLYCLAVSADGRMLVTGAQDNTLRLWDIPLPRPIQWLPAHEGTAAGLALFPDASSLISVGADHKLRIQPLQGIQPPAMRDGHAGPVSSSAVRNDNSMLATGDANGVVLLWSPVIEQPQSEIGAHDGDVAEIAFHPNNQQFLTAGSDGTLKLWQLPIVPPRTLAGHTAAARAVALSPNQPLAVTGGDDKVLRVFNTQNAQLVREIAGQAAAIHAVAVRNDTALIASGDESGQIRFWNFGDGADRLGFGGHDGAVASLAFHPDNQRIASAGADGTFRLWTIPAPPQPLGGHGQPLRDVTISPNGQWYATASDDQTVRLWDANGGAQRALQGFGQPVRSIAFRGDNAQLAAGDAFGVLRIFNPNDGALLTTIGAHTSPLIGIAWAPSNQAFFTLAEDGSLKHWSPPVAPRVLTGHGQPVQGTAVTSDGAIAVTGSPDQTVRVWNAANGQAIRNLEGQQGPVRSVAVSPDDRLVAAAGDAGIVRLWNLADGAPLPPLLGHAGAIVDVAFGPEGSQIATADADGMVRIWRTTRATTELPGDKSPSQAAAVSRDGTRLAVGGTAGDKPAIFIRDLQSGNVIATLTGHEGPVTALAFNKDGTRLISGSGDKTARVWNTADAQFPQLTVLPDHPGVVQAVALSDDGATAFTSGSENDVRQWNVADASLTRNITGHGNQVTSLLFAGPYVISSSSDGTVRWWNPADGAAVRSVNHGAAVTSIAMSHDATRLLSGGADQNGKLWNAADGQLIATLAGSPAAVTDVAIAANGERLACRSSDGIRIWDAAGRPVERIETTELAAHGLHFGADSRSLVLTATDGAIRVTPLAVSALLAGHQGAVSSVAFSTDGKHLLSGGADMTVRVWSTEDGSAVRTLSGAGQPITAVDVAGAIATASAADGQVYLWNFAESIAAPGGPPLPPVRTLAYPAAVRGVALSGDGLHLATCGDDLIVRLWDTATGVELERFSGHTAAAVSVDFARDGKSLVSGGADNTARAWSVSLIAHAKLPQPATDLEALPGEQGVATVDGATPNITIWTGATEPPQAHPLGQSPLTGLAVAPNGSELAACDAEGRLHRLSLPDRQPLESKETGVPIVAIEYSGDGAHLATADNQQRVRVYSLKPFRLLEEMTATTAVARMAVAPDSRSLLLQGTEPTPYLWKRSLLSITDAHPGGATGVSLSPNSQFAATCGGDKSVHLWNLGDGQKVRSFAGLEQPATSVAFSADSNRVFASAANGEVRVWNTGDGSELARVSHGAAVTEVSPSPDGTKFATCGGDGVVRVWDFASQQQMQFFTGHDGAVQGIRFASDNKSVISVGDDMSGRVWSVAALWTTAAHPGGVRDVALFAGGGQVITGGADQRVAAWNTGNGQLIREFSGAGDVRAVAVRNDNQRLATAAGNQIFIWNPNDGSRLAELSGPEDVQALAFSPDNQKLAAAGRTEVRIYGPPMPPQQGVELVLHQQTAAESPFTELAFAADNRRLYGTHESGHVSEWAYAAPAPVRQFNHGGAVYGVAMSADGKTIVSCSADQTVRVWDATNGQQRSQLNGHQGAVYSLALSADAALALSSGADNTLRLWDIGGGRQLKQLPAGEGNVYSIAINPQGSLFATAGADRTVRLFDLLTGDEVRALPGHPDYIHCVAFNPAGTRLLSYGYAGNLMFWKPEDGAQLHAAQTGRVGNFAAWSADGARLVLANGNGEAQIVTVPAAAQ